MPERAGDSPFVTVVMPALNEGEHIGRTLRALVDQDYPEDRFEVVVADGGSTDDTAAIVRELGHAHPPIRLLENPGRRSSAGRNVGFREGRGEYFLVVDAHCEIPSRTLLRDLVETFERSGADAIGRPQPLLPADTTATARAIVAARSSLFGHSLRSLIYSSSPEEAVSIASCGAMYRRSVFTRVGYVDETFDACEDVEFNHRIEKAGLKTHFAPELAVSYRARASLRALFRQMLRYGRGRVRLARKHPDASSLEAWIPPLLTLGTVVAAAALLIAPAAGQLLTLPLALYGALVLVAAIATAVARRDPRLFLPSLFVFPTIHYGLGTGILLEALSRWDDSWHQAARTEEHSS